MAIPFTGSPFVTPNLTANTTYNVRCENSTCISSFVPVTVTVVRPFITTWNLATTGSGANQLSFGVATSGTASYTWETVPAGTSGSGTFSGTTLTITGLPTSATIDLSISPTNFQRINIANGTDKSRLIDVKQWGDVAWTSMFNAFNGCNNLVGSASDVPNLSGVTNMQSMFFGATAFNQEIGSWNTAAVTDMSYMFFGATAFNQNISTWNTAAVTAMQSMFFGATAFNQEIGSWNTAAVTDMSNMFYGATAFNKNIGTLTWNTAAVTDMSFMFRNATNFNQNIGSWNTAAVTNMSGMFNDATAFNQNISSWNTTAVTNMSSMFSGATAFNQNIGSWGISAVTNMAGLFANATAFNQSLAAWGVNLNASVDMILMLQNCGMNIANYDATLTGFNAGSVTGRNLGALGRQYCASVADRANLINVKGWTISGDANASPSAPTGTSNPSICNNATASLAATCASGNVAWYGSNSTTLLSTISPFITPNLTSATTYNVRCESGTCLSSFVAVNVSINAVTAPTGTANATICNNATASLSATCATGNVAWYGSNSTSLLSTISPFVTPNLTSTTTYNVRCESGSCQSSFVAVNVTVAPVILTPTGNTTISACSGNSVSLNASCSLASPVWYDSATSQSGTAGAAFTTPILTNATNANTITSYFVACETGDEPNCVSSRMQVDVTVVPQPTAPTGTSDATICSGATAPLSATCASGNVAWYGSNSTTLLSTISPFVTPNLTSATTYNVRCESGTCLSSFVAVNVSINDVSTPTGTNSPTICSGTTASLSASCTSGNVAWYGSNSTSLLSTISPFVTPNLTSTTTYNVRCESGSCQSSFVAVNVTINGVTAPTGTSNPTICNNATASLAATCASGNVAWYGSNSTSLLSTISPFVTPNLTSTTTYNVRCESGSCQSSFVAVNVTINGVTAPTGTANATICNNATTSLSATCASGNVAWYGSNSTTLLSTISPFVTPNLTSATTYKCSLRKWNLFE